MCNIRSMKLLETFSVFVCATLLVACTDTLTDVKSLNTNHESIYTYSDDSAAKNDYTSNAVEYYNHYGIELKETMPYTYIMNKYIDIALDYMNEWDMYIAGLDLASKKRLFEESSAWHLNPDREDIDLEGSDEDMFFCELYNQLAEELNTFPVIEQYLAENNVMDLDDIILPFEGGFAYSKIDILYCVENNLALEHEQYNTEDYYEEDECGCNQYYSASAPASSNPQRLIRYDLLSKWLTDIRYRNYKNSCPDIDAMREAMNEWEEASSYAIRFKEIKDNGWNRFSWGIGCNYHICISDNCSDDGCGVSSVGAVPWAFVHISPNCPEKGTCLHELGHTLTLEHEQCRPDRDCYINVHYDNVTCSGKVQFHKFLETSVTTYGPFDFNSIMLYHSWAFSKNGEPTMTKKDGSTFYAQRDHLSESDRLHICSIYH